MRIMVTGGAGFIGSHLAEKLLAVGHEVVILDDFNDFYDPQIKDANIAGFAKDVTVCRVDLRENDSVRTVLRREKLDAVVHLAARAGVRPSIQSPRRYYTYIHDIIQGTMAALDYHGALYDVFNLGENQTVQLKDLISAIENAVGKKAKINRLAEQPGDMPRTYADISKARKLLGYNPTTKLSEGLPKFVEWFLRTQRASRAD